MALTVQGSGDGVEAKQDDDDDIGDHVGQHLEPEEGVDLDKMIVNIMKIRNPCPLPPR